uniref:uncharacterized protein LOC128932315 n=1 Tax=Callithrix jacchus TaxID=9483 RepID=UPI0023DD2829|nr:uncharacterized protein LOC128932315 [Callithrix jacchus]
MTCPCSWRPFKDSMGGLTGPVWPVKEASLQLSLWLGSIIQQLLSLHLLQVYDDNDACSPQSGWMGLGQSLSEKLFSRKDPKCSKVKGAIFFFTDSEDTENCPISPIFLTPIFNSVPNPKLFHWPSWS